jgi:hypothetical protein
MFSGNYSNQKNLEWLVGIQCYQNDTVEILNPLYSDGKAIKVNGFVVKINNRWQYDVTMNEGCIINE